MQYLSAAEVESLSDDDLDEAVFHHVLHSLSRDGADGSEQEQRIATLSSNLRQLYAMVTLELQVYNGGFHQYFFNCGDTLILEAVQGYEKIGAVHLAELTSRAAKTYKAEKEAQERVKSLVQTEGWQAFADSYNETELVSFDAPFYQAEREARLKTLRAKYIRHHSTEFELSELEACWDFTAGSDPNVLNEFNMPTRRPGWIDPCPLRKS